MSRAKDHAAGIVTGLWCASAALTPASARFSMEIVLPGLRRALQINELGMFLCQRMLELLLGEGYRALAVQFVTDPPDDEAPLRRVFVARTVAPSRDLSRPATFVRQGTKRSLGLLRPRCRHDDE